MNTKTLNLFFTLAIIGVALYLLSQLSSFFGSGGAGANLISNSLTGGLTASQQSTLIANETAELVQAGDTPAQASAQAASDVAAGQQTGVSYGSALLTAITSPFATASSILG